MSRGENYFRSTVIEALGDYKARYAFDAVTTVARLEGPLQDDAALTLGKIGPRFQPASTYRTGFSPSRPDIVGAVRDIGYKPGCSCFAYLSPTLWPVR